MTPLPPPPSAAPPTALDDLCEELGVYPWYESGGVIHRAPEDTLISALQALGAPVRGPDDAGDALRAVRSAKAARVLPASSVSWADEAPSIVIRLPSAATAHPIELEIISEDGDRASRAVTADELRRPRGDEAGEWDVLEAELRLPADLPPGYHDVSVRMASGHRGRTVLIRTPRTAWQPHGRSDGGLRPPSGATLRPGRRWGSFLPLHALRTERSWGTGDLADLRSLARWTADRGGELVGTLPLYDTFLGARDPFDPSPYAPVSRLFWNPVWITLEEAPGLRHSAAALAAMESTELRERAAGLRDSAAVDYAAVMALKRTVLETLAAAHRGDGPHGLGRELTAWIRENPEALAYARFRAHTETTGMPWTRWPSHEAGGDDGALAPPDEAVRYHVYAQWAVDGQLRKLADEIHAPLYLDLPLSSHPQGFDPWRDQDRFARGFTVGAPPDAFYEGGQDWSFAPVHPHRSAEDGHAYWGACLRGAMEMSGALRLDHVMALHRLYWIPRGASAAEGVYVRYPAEDLWAVLCLESHGARTMVVGEDLGTVPPAVPEAMERHGVGRMWVLPFEVAADDHRAYRVDTPPDGAMASLDTHDLPPFAAFYYGTDIDARTRAGLVGAETAELERKARDAWRGALLAFLRDRGFLDEDAGGSRVDAATALDATLPFLAESPAGTVLINLEDLWLETRQQNVPGTPATENWIQKARLTLEEMAADDRVLDRLRRVDQGRRTAFPDVQSPS